MTHFSWLDYTLFIGYLIAMVSVGFLFVKEQHTVKDFFLAGRSMGSFVVCISVIAALFSSISYLGAPSEVYSNGLAFFWVSLSFFIATPFTTIFLLPFFYRARFTTAYQYLEERFSLPVRLLSSGMFILRVLLWLSGAVYASALALQQATGMDMTFSILTAGILTTFYTTLGGMKAVIWTDVMQFFVLIGGQLLILLVAFGKLPGGWSELMDVAVNHGQAFPKANIDPHERLNWMGLIIGGAFMSLVQMATDQVSVQRYMTSRSLGEARKALWMKLAFTLPVLSLFYGTGIVLRAFYNHGGDPLASHAIERSDQILPYFVVHELPSGFPGILVAAVFGASMSVASAGLNSLASATMVDFQQRLGNAPLPSDARQIMQARAWTVFYGVVMILLAFVIRKLGTLVEATNTIIGVVGGPLLGLFILGIFFRRVGSRAALIGCVLGFVATLTTKLWGMSFAPGETIGAVMSTWLPAFIVNVCDYLSRISFLWFTFLGTSVTCAWALLLSCFKGMQSSKELRGLVWDQEMMGNQEQV